MKNFKYKSNIWLFRSSFSSSLKSFVLSLIVLSLTANSSAIFHSLYPFHIHPLCVTSVFLLFSLFLSSHSFSHHHLIISSSHHSSSHLILILIFSSSSLSLFLFLIYSLSLSFHSHSLSFLLFLFLGSRSCVCYTLLEKYLRFIEQKNGEAYLKLAHIACMNAVFE